jgi:tyrosyl-tRNA synthetase
MKFIILKNGEWKAASEEDIKEGIKTIHGIEIDNLDKLKVCVNDKWVKGTELIEDK